MSAVPVDPKPPVKISHKCDPYPDLVAVIEEIAGSR